MVTNFHFQHTLAKLYIEILGLGKDSPAAQKLLNFRAPKMAKSVSIELSNVLCIIVCAALYCYYSIRAQLPTRDPRFSVLALAGMLTLVHLCDVICRRLATSLAQHS